MPTPSRERYRPLSQDRAFVVQLGAADPAQPEQLGGRVEHIASGQAAEFDSMGELQTFMSQIVAVPPCKQGPGS